MNEIIITVFTPTYNRCELLSRLFKSLKEQTNYNFEWLVIDDGSTDDTSVFFDDIMSQKGIPFPVRYYKQENGGKHRAVNRGVKEANGKMFFIVDSDDYLISEAIEMIISWVNTLDSSKKWAGVSGLKGYSVDECVGAYNMSKYVDATNLERDKYNLSGDKSEVYFTEILRKYPFPEFEGEKFLTEAVVWDRIAFDGYYIRWFNKIIYICDYLCDGLTKAGISKYTDNPQGTLYRTRQIIAYYKHDKKKQYSEINRYCEAFKGKYNISEVSISLNIKRTKVILSIIIVRIGRIVKKLIG